MKELAGKIAVVTGAASGIGLGVARALSQAGMRVALLDIRRDALDSARRQLSESGAQVVETSEYPALRQKVILATQSGPLLVRGGKIHPAFNANSQSRTVRNGVGVPSPAVAVFAISEEAVNLYEFATLFRDVLGCPDALYLDGFISSLHSTRLKRNDKKTDLGPIIGLAE